MIKCLIWDLDDTLWEGALLNGGARALKRGVAETIKALDARGILQSVASKNDHEAAWPVIEAFGLAEFFLHPQISWSGKAESVRTIGDRLGIGLDAIALIDDQAAERDEVAFFLPMVTTIDAAEVGQLLDRQDLTPAIVTDEARLRRSMYLSDQQRVNAEEAFVGPRDAFLATLETRITIHPAREGDLRRAEELTIRTNQLNTTGHTYAFDELEALARSKNHLLLVAKLEDRYGSSGTIGLALVETAAETWTIKLLIMSCRVMTRGVGTVLLGHILRRARLSGVCLQANFVHTERNRQMYMTYKFAGFRDIGEVDGAHLLEHDLMHIHALPSYVTVAADVDVESI